MSIVSTFINAQGFTTTVPDEFDANVEGQYGWTRVPEGMNGTMNGGSVGTMPTVQPVSLTTGMTEGADLRDFGGDVPEADIAGTDPWWGFAAETEPTSTAGAPAGVSQVGLIALALRTLLAMVGRGGRVTRLAYSRLATWQKFVLQAAGVVIGTILSNELVDGLMGGDGDDPVSQVQLPAGATGNLPVSPGAHMDIPGVHLGAHIIGSWNTNPDNPENGVTFYRLSDGKLAVQNKKGRWKIWRPKRPIVLFADGAGDLKTMLRAEKALARQAKQIAGFLRRHGYGPKPAKKGDKTPAVIIESGAGHVVTR